METTVKGKSRQKVGKTAKGVTKPLDIRWLSEREMPPLQTLPENPYLALRRTLDVMHVAAAVLVNATGFMSFDREQRKLAEAEELAVHP